MPTITRLVRKTAMFPDKLLLFSDLSVLKRFLMDNCNAKYTLSVKLPCFPDKIDYLGQVPVMIMLNCSESGDFMACQDICVKHIDKVGDISGEIKSLGSARLCLRCELPRPHTKFRVSALRDEFRRRDGATALSVIH